jgi:hypothetical protein
MSDIQYGLDDGSKKYVQIRVIYAYVAELTSYPDGNSIGR